MWTVYILRCADNTLYTGIALDVARRIVEHNSSNRLGASYTRGRRPVKLVYSETAASRSDAAKREHEIKCMTRGAKMDLLRKARMQSKAKVKV
jgi:putative endonuclease